MSTTNVQNRTNSNVNGLNGRLLQLQEGEARNVQQLDDATRQRYGFCGPVFVTVDAMQDPHLADALDWFNGSYESVTTGETRDIGHGFSALFGFNPAMPNALAFFVFISKRATH